MDIQDVKYWDVTVGTATLDQIAAHATGRLTKNNLLDQDVKRTRPGTQTEYWDKMRNITLGDLDHKDLKTLGQEHLRLNQRTTDGPPLKRYRQDVSDRLSPNPEGGLTMFRNHHHGLDYGTMSSYNSTGTITITGIRVLAPGATADCCTKTRNTSKGTETYYSRDATPHARLNLQRHINSHVREVHGASTPAPFPDVDDKTTETWNSAPEGQTPNWEQRVIWTDTAAQKRNEDFTAKELNIYGLHEYLETPMK
jgi:hypothetical protein